jgi:hypothetical protein
MLAFLARLFDRLEAFWESTRTRRVVAAVLVLVFLGDVLLIELGRRGVLPHGLSARLPRNHFRAVEVAFYLLLAFEVVGLVFALSRSVTSAAGKQIEIFSLILLRHSFEEFGHLDEPVTWEGAREPVVHMLANGFGALALFVVLGFYYAAQRHRPISDDARDTRGFVAAKKTLSLVLLAVFGVLAARSQLGVEREFFESFYTVLVFADVLVVLVSLRYSSSYHVVFRNSGLAVATVLLRLALSAPVYWNAALGFAAALFALGLTLAGNRFAPVLRRLPEHEAGTVRARGS